MNHVTDFKEFNNLISHKVHDIFQPNLQVLNYPSPFPEPIQLPTVIQLPELNMTLDNLNKSLDKYNLKIVPKSIQDNNIYF